MPLVSGNWTIFTLVGGGFFIVHGLPGSPTWIIGPGRGLMHACDMQI